MDHPSFIERDGAKILAELVAGYEALTGRTLHPAQAERLVLSAFAYRELLLREEMQALAISQLVAFSSGPMLDYLGQLQGLTRLPESASTSTVRFSLVAGHNGVVVPANTRVATTGGQASFQTIENVSAPTGASYVDIVVFCTVAGTGGNGFPIGGITKLLDPLAFVSGVLNTSATAGGADVETDDEFRERIMIAPSAFSVAGPVDAYKFHAKSASAAILDVAIPDVPITPGQVNVYPLTETIPTPTEVINVVQAALSNTKIRPLTDTVVVSSPDSVEYAIEIEITIYPTADATAIQTAALAAVTAYAAERQKVLGKDIVRAQLTKLCVIDENQVYNVVIVSPSSDVEIEFNEVPVYTSILVTVTGSDNG